MKRLFLSTLVLLLSFSGLRANDEDSLVNELKAYIKLIDSVNQAMKYETGLVKLPNGIAQLNIPAGFKFLNQEQSQYVVTDLWGNPPDNTIIGMIFPENGGPYADSSYAFIVSYEAIGYVKDEDADKIDYDEMFKDHKKGEAKENAERIKMGYPDAHWIGWAQKPFYDKNNKILHWAKELQFGENDYHTLNYDVRILGRKGILSLNAVATMSELEMVKGDIDKVLHIASFTDGNKYADFDSNVDEVAAWTIGGLVAGKVLAKAGFFVVILKYLKFIILGIAALGGGLFKFFKNRKRDEEITYDPAAPADNNSNV